MYNLKGAATAAGGSLGASLPFTGMNTLGMIVAALVLIFAGMALMKLVPKIKRS